MFGKLLRTIAVLFCVVSSAIYACPEEDEAKNAEKVYVGADQIQYFDNKIYVLIEKEILETPALFSDERGYYVILAAKSGNCAWYEWKCTRCGYCNLRGIDWECKSCQYPVSN